MLADVTRLPATFGNPPSPARGRGTPDHEVVPDCWIG
jgi:hypothetical protein